MNAAASPFRCVLDIRASLGECATWSVAERVLYWVDINAPSLNRFDPATGRNVAMPMPSAIGCYGVRRSGGFVVALRDGVWLTRADGSLERKVADAPYDPHHHRFNDGRVDPYGRLVVGTMNEARDGASAALYLLDASCRLTEIFGGLTISNGLGWSPDGRTMYHADTPTHRIDAYDYDRDRGPTGKRTLAQFHGATDRPDGGVVDRAGCYWSAFYRGGKVVRIAPDGTVLAEHAVPAMCPTMCAFGGDDLRTLFVTTARQERPADELERYPQSGGIFAMDVDTPGLVEYAFGG